MGRHFCKLCLCSHPLPPISSSQTQAEGEGGVGTGIRRAGDEMLASSGIDPSPLPLSCFEPSQLASSDHVELIVAGEDDGACRDRDDPPSSPHHHPLPSLSSLSPYLLSLSLSSPSSNLTSLLPPCSLLTLNHALDLNCCIRCDSTARTKHLLRT